MNVPFFFIYRLRHLPALNVVMSCCSQDDRWYNHPILRKKNGFSCATLKSLVNSVLFTMYTKFVDVNRDLFTSKGKGEITMLFWGAERCIYLFDCLHSVLDSLVEWLIVFPCVLLSYCVNIFYLFIYLFTFLFIEREVI